MKQIRLDEIKEPDNNNDDWMYKPILRTNTRTDYDSDGIQQENIEEYESLSSTDITED